MSRWWDEFVAGLGDLVPGGVPVLCVLLFLLTGLISLLAYTWPAWLPWKWWHKLAPRGGARREKRGSAAPTDEQPDELPEDVPPADEDELLPDVPAAVLALSADELAAAGRYAEAVRERLRAIVRDLIERQVIDYRAGWTVTELATAAATARPGLTTPLRAAAGTFSEIWYALRPATAADDAAMRQYAAQVHTLLGPTATEAGR